MLTRLTLTDFRSYAHAEIAPGPGFVVLTGDNGAGKTNVLEAVSLLAPGRGLRGAALGEVARADGPGGFAISAEVDGATLGTGTRADAPERRLVRINSAPGSASALGEWLSVVWLTPSQDRLFADTPGERRRFLDRLVLALDSGHAHHASRYEAAMRQRNRLLAEQRPDPHWLDALEAAMAEHGTALATSRAALVVQLDAALAAGVVSAFPRAGLALTGWDGRGDFLRERARDAAAGRTLQGPHRQDLVVTHLTKQQPAARCSTGEQKALLIGIVLAHAALVAARSGRAPVLLLDEVAAHLDPGRRAALFERLAGQGQVWMTGTERAPFAGARDADHLIVADGAIRPA